MTIAILLKMAVSSDLDSFGLVRGQTRSFPRHLTARHDERHAFSHAVVINTIRTTVQEEVTRSRDRDVMK